MKQHSLLVADVPDTGWRPPAEFPRLDAAKILTIDVETKDPNLIAKGPGDRRRDGHVVGIAVGADDDGRWYFPMRHEVGEEMNLDPDAVLRWARAEFNRPRQTKLGANILYDLGWLDYEGVKVSGPFIDVQYAEPLLDEHQFEYSLGAIAKRRLGEGKVEEAMYEWASRAYGGAATRDAQAGNIYRCPPAIVGPYAESDVDLPGRIFVQQARELKEQELTELFVMECRLIPLLLEMRKLGVRVDLARCEEVREALDVKKRKAQKALDRLAGFGVDVWSNDSLERVTDKLSIATLKTPTGKSSFRKAWLEHHPSEFARHVLDVRRYDKARGTFIDGAILNQHINGRIHCSFHPLRTDDNGTISGRFSSSGPNLQQVPSRDEELGPLIRSLFIPEEDCQWRRYDASQIEYRDLVHFAIGHGAQEAVLAYRTNPKTDYHEMTRQTIYSNTGQLLDRKPTKNINFGLVFGMGVDALAGQLGLSRAEAEKLFDIYHAGLPFVRKTKDRASEIARSRGYIKTILGRRARFPNGERTHKALNALTQGSAADTIKKAMVTLYEEGAAPIPHLTVHDELDFSDDGSWDWDRVREILETCVPMKVPLLWDCTTGKNWGECK